VSYETATELDIRVRAGLSERAPRFFTLGDVRGFINEAQDFLVREDIYSVKGSWKELSVPKSTTYLLPEDLIAPEYVYATNSAGQKYRVTFQQQDEHDQRNWMRASTTTADVISTVTYGRVAEGLTAEIYPALSTYRFLIWAGGKRMKKLVNDSDRTECPPGLSHILVHYALWQCKKKDEEVRQAQDWERQVARDVLEVRAGRMRELASDQNARVKIRRNVGRYHR
jgi:hypothetical protein